MPSVGARSPRSVTTPNNPPAAARLAFRAWLLTALPKTCFEAGTSCTNCTNLVLCTTYATIGQTRHQRSLNLDAIQLNFALAPTDKGNNHGFNRKNRCFYG